jgi:hypothetical protein
MTVLALIPPIVDGAATIRDAGSTLSVLCYWALPYALMGVVGVLNGAFPPWFAARSALVDARDGNPQVAPPPRHRRTPRTGSCWRCPRTAATTSRSASG